MFYICLPCGEDPDGDEPGICYRGPLSHAKLNGLFAPLWHTKAGTKSLRRILLTFHGGSRHRTFGSLDHP